MACGEGERQATNEPASAPIRKPLRCTKLGHACLVQIFLCMGAPINMRRLPRYIDFRSESGPFEPYPHGCRDASCRSYLTLVSFPG